MKLLENYPTDTTSAEDYDFIFEKETDKVDKLYKITEAMVMLESINVESEECIDKWKMFCETTGLPYDLNISKEAIVSKKEGTTGLLTRMFNSVVDTITDINTVLHTFAGFNISEIESLKEDLEKGNLVPRKEMPRIKKEKLQDQLASFFVLGNSLNKGTDDLIEYMKEPVDNLISGKYEDFISKHWKIMWNTDANKAKEYAGLRLDLSNLKMELKISNSQKEDILISFLVKRFSSKLYMYSLFRSDDLSYKDRENIDFSNPYNDNIDILDIPSKYIEDIKILDKKEIIKLLDWAIKENRDIIKAITESKVLFHKYNTKAYLLNIVTSLNPTVSVMHQLMGGRMLKSLITHIGNVSRDIIYYDKLIRDLVYAMYERK